MIRALVSVANLTAFDTIEYSKPEALVDAPFAEATGFYFEYLPLNRKVVDQVPLSEVQVFTVTKTAPDSTAETIDDVVLSPTKRQTIIAQALDQFSRVVVFNRDVVDTASFTEAVQREVTSVSEDSLGSSESQVFTVIARPQDFVNSTDDFLGAQNVDDDQYMHFTKVANRFVALGDEDVKSLDIQRPDLPTSLSDTHVSSVGKDAGTDSASSFDQVDRQDTTLFKLEKFSTSDTEVGSLIDDTYFAYQRVFGYPDADINLQGRIPIFNLPSALTDEAEFDVTHDENITASATDSDGKHILIQRLEPNPYPYSSNYLQNSWRSIESSYYARVAANGYDGSLGNLAAPADNTGPYLGYLQFVYGIFGPDTTFYFAEDEHVITVSKAESETITLSEIDTRAVTKIESESPSVGDLSVIDLSKIVSDSIALTDSHTSQNTQERLFSETITTTDDLDGQAGVDDDQNMHFYKLRTNSAGLQDQAVLTPTKDISDTASFSDAGSILAQGYTVGMTYFSSDYVGTSGSF